MCHMVGVDGCDDVGTYGNGASRVVGIDVGWAFVQASRKKFAGLRFERLDVLEDQQFVVRARKGTAHTCSGNFAVAMLPSGSVSIRHFCLSENGCHISLAAHWRHTVNM